MFLRAARLAFVFAACAVPAVAAARHEYKITLGERSLRDVAAKGHDARQLAKRGAAGAVEPLAAAADALAAWYRALPESARAAKDFRFPKSTPWTPAALPCPGAKAAPPADDSGWSHPTWRALGYRPKASGRHQFRFVSMGRGAEAMFALVARGDVDCNGKRSMLRISGHARGGALKLTVLRLRNPHE